MDGFGSNGNSVQARGWVEARELVVGYGFIAVSLAVASKTGQSAFGLIDEIDKPLVGPIPGAGQGFQAANNGKLKGMDQGRIGNVCAHGWSFWVRLWFHLPRPSSLSFRTFELSAAFVAVNTGR